MKNTGRVFVSHVLRGEPVAFESTKTLKEYLEKIDREDVVYEDEHTIAYIQRDTDTGAIPTWTHRVAIALKEHVPTLLDLDVSDQRSIGALLRAIQAVAFKLDLYDKGFEIRADTLPPMQRRGFLEIKLRSGKHKEEPQTAPGTQPAATTAS